MLFAYRTQVQVVGKYRTSSSSRQRESMSPSLIAVGGRHAVRAGRRHKGTGEPWIEGGLPRLRRPDVIPKCGSLVNWHWANARHQDCDPWSEPIGPWHLSWQDIVLQKSCRGRSRPAPGRHSGKLGDRHRATALVDQQRTDPRTREFLRQDGLAVRCDTPIQRNYVRRAIFFLFWSNKTLDVLRKASISRLF